MDTRCASLLRLSALLAAILWIAPGCELLQPSDSAPPPVEPALPTPQPEPEPVPQTAPSPPEPVSARGYVLRAIERLEVGDEDRARTDLERALALQPRNNMANTLIEQFDVDPVVALGEESFPYTIQYGDSLSLIADRYLGDSLKFYILARYNGIDNPSRLAAGGTIRVPGQRPQSKLRPGPEPADSAAQTKQEDGADALSPSTEETDAEAAAAGSGDEAPVPPPVAAPAEEEALTTSPLAPTSVDYSVAKLNYLQGNYEEAIGILENSATDSESRELLVLSYTAQADQLVAAGRLPEARSVLASAAALEPSNPTIKTQLATIDDRIEADLLFEQGMAEIRAGEHLAAYESFNQALVYRPDHVGANEQLAVAKQELIGEYLVGAAARFREQELDEAIDLWDKVLELDPDNAVARSRRSTALKVKKRLEESQ